MKVSVLTVCWNSAETISHTLDSFFEQTHDEKEMVLIDGGSTDRTVEIARRYSSDNLQILSEPDQGMYDALNKGLSLYTGDAIGVLNSDDAYHDSTVLHRISEGLRNTDMVHGHLNFINDHRKKSIERRWRAKSAGKSGFRGGWMPAHPTFYVRREVADAVGQFNLDYKVASDYDWMLRATELHSFKLKIIDHVMVDMMLGGASTVGLGSYIRHNLEALRSRQRWLNAGLVDYAMFAKPLRKLGQFISPLKKPSLS